jgi:cytochrome c peroxidase
MFDKSRFGSWLGPGLLMVALVGGCEGDDSFTDREWVSIMKMQPFGTEMPPNPYYDMARDPLSANIAALGQQLFFEKELADAITVPGPSGNMGETGKVGCVTCHDTKYFTDSRTGRVSHGRTGPLARNTPALVNLGYYEWTLWTGRFDSMVEHGSGAWGSSTTPIAYSRYIYKKYKEEYNAAFPDTQLDERLGIPVGGEGGVFPAAGGPAAAGAAPGAFEMMPDEAQQAIHQIRYNLGKAWDAYPRMLKTPNSPFERYSKGEADALSPQAKRGLKLFMGKAACNDCHTGSTLTDNQFHNIGVPDPKSTPWVNTTPAPDRGRAASVAAVLGSLAILDAPEPPLTRPAIFNGGSSFSEDPAKGLQRLKDYREYTFSRCVMPDPKTLDPDPAISEPALRVGACLKYDDTIEGVFRTPTLLNIAATGPYFHTGEAATLYDVVQHYNRGGGAQGTFVGTKSARLRPLLLTEDEVLDIVAFLESLTGEAPIDSTDMEVRKWALNTAKAPLPPPMMTTTP